MDPYSYLVDTPEPNFFTLRPHRDMAIVVETNRMFKTRVVVTSASKTSFLRGNTVMVEHSDTKLSTMIKKIPSRIYYKIKNIV